MQIAADVKIVSIIADIREAKKLYWKKGRFGKGNNREVNVGAVIWSFTAAIVNITAVNIKIRMQIIKIVSNILLRAINVMNIEYIEDNFM